MPSSEGRSKRSMSLLAGLAVLGSMFVLAAIGQQAPANSGDVNLVNVLATVRDKHGKIVNNLSQNDFILNEEGRQQTIRSFSRETDLPLTLGLLVDTSPSQRKALEQERSASGHFIDQVLREEKDKAFLIHFDREVELLQDLTPSKQKLNSALGSLQQPQLKRDEDDFRRERVSEERTRLGPLANGRRIVVRLRLPRLQRTDAETAGTQGRHRSFRRCRSRQQSDSGAGNRSRPADQHRCVLDSVCRPAELRR